MHKIKDKLNGTLIAIMQLGLVGALLWSIFHFEWLNIFVSAIALLIVWIPSILKRNWKVHFPVQFELILNIFIYASIFLGEIRGFYTKFWWWDILLHFSSGLALAFIGFLIVYSLYVTQRLKSGPFLLALFAFSFSLSLGVIWEIFEFTMDQVFNLNMQKPMFNDYSGLTDTMWDLIADAFGSFLVSVSAYFYVKNKRHGFGIFNYFVETYNKKEEN